jgi:ElaB/YqjD/DUF883 family membrane-anchored ribosome-binding protein
MGTRNHVDLRIVREWILSRKDDQVSESRNIRELKKDMDKRLSELKVQMDALQERAAQKVADQPLLALGVAFVAGMALGVALSKSGE